MDTQHLPTRKPTRLQGHDYSENGAYFVTVCTKDKRNILSRIVGEGLCALPSVELSPIGKIVEQSLHYINTHIPFVTVDHYVIMPNHVYLIVEIHNTAGGRGGPPLHHIIGQFKSFTTHRYGRVLWQRSYYDHIIRSEDDYAAIASYIDTNPAKWREDTLFCE